MTEGGPSFWSVTRGEVRDNEAGADDKVSALVFRAVRPESVISNDLGSGGPPLRSRQYPGQGRFLSLTPRASR